MSIHLNVQSVIDSAVERSGGTSWRTSSRGGPLREASGVGRKAGGGWEARYREAQKELEWHREQTKCLRDKTPDWDPTTMLQADLVTMRQERDCALEKARSLELWGGDKDPLIPALQSELDAARLERDCALERAQKEADRASEIERKSRESDASLMGQMSSLAKRVDRRTEEPDEREKALVPVRSEDEEILVEAHQIQKLETQIKLAKIASSQAIGIAFAKTKSLVIVGVASALLGGLISALAIL